MLDTVFETQIQFIRLIQEARTPLCDSVMRLFDYFDRQEFLFVLIPVIWLGVSWQAGLRLFYLLGLNHVINFGLKNFFCFPRPFHLDSSLGLIHVKGYGFPSGAAQTAILLSGLVLLHTNNRWKWILVTAYTLLVSFSRLFLGVHFPLDILGGWVAGLLVLSLYWFLFPKMERFFQTLSPTRVLLLTQVPLLLVLLFMPPPTLFSLCTCAMGLATGIFINTTCHIRISLQANQMERVIRVLIGILGVFLIHGSVSKIFTEQTQIGTFFQFFLIGVWISCLASAISSQLAPARKE